MPPPSPPLLSSSLFPFASLTKNPSERMLLFLALVFTLASVVNVTHASDGLLRASAVFPHCDCASTSASFIHFLLMMLCFIFSLSYCSRSNLFPLLLPLHHQQQRHPRLSSSSFFVQYCYSDIFLINEATVAGICLALCMHVLSV